MSAITLASIAVQVATIAAVGWAAGDLLLGWALRGRGDAGAAGAGAIGLPERGLAAVGGFVAFSVGLMVGHIVTGGAVFGLPGAAPIAAAAVVWHRQASFAELRALPWRPLAVAGALLVVMFVAPAVAAGSGVRNGDPAWHLGWTEQLLGGEPVPVGPAPEFARNAYPWGWHAVLASAVRLVPGTDPLIAHESLHVVVVFAIPLAAACLARRFTPAAGWAAAAASSVIGGFGWLFLDRPDFAFSPAEADGADLVITSPNAVYESLPPALPRELALVLLGLAAVLVVVAVRSSDARTGAAAGAVSGLVGLVSVPLLVTALLWSAAGALCGAPGRRARLLASFVGPAAALFALWAGPVTAGYVRYGGFVNISRLGREWPLPSALASWGLLLPLAAAGVCLTWRGNAGARAERAVTRAPEARVAVVWAGSIAVLLGFAMARAAFGWNLGGNATLLNQNRVWPAGHLLASAFAGVGLVGLYRLGATRSPALGAGACAALLSIGAVSPALATMRAAEVLGEGDSGYIYATPDLSEGEFVRAAAAYLGPDDVVGVLGSDDLAWLLWQFSGARLAHYDDPRFEDNDLRVRYTDLANAWDAKMRAGGFRATHRVVPAGSKAVSPEASPLARGTFGGREWELRENSPD